MKFDLYDEMEKKIENYFSNEDSNRWRNNFHIEMPFGLVNDPNGLSYFNGEFYIFYQWNPFGCEHKTKHWGLVKTKDFVNFTKPKVILKPEDYFDKSGCYSGCAIEKDGELKLFYTGNVKNEENNRFAYQCIATMQKDGSYKKDGVVIEKQPEGYTEHFRDPFIFVEDDIYYCIIGAQNMSLKGRAIVYKSINLEKWDCIGELKTDMEDFGYMWECPNLVKLNDSKYAFVLSPQGIKSKEFRYQNIYQSGYVIGNLDLDTVTMKHNEFKELDMGFEFYAPQIFNYNGENIMLAWVGMPECEKDYRTSDYGWIFGLTIPRVIEYKNNKLYQKPYKILENLREKTLINIINGHTVDNFNIDINNRSVEIIVDVDIKESNNTEFRFNFGEEFVSVSYYKDNNVCIVSRENMNLQPKGIRKFKLKAKDTLKLHIFMDKSVMEIFYEDGLEVTTVMYFPNYDGLNFEISSDRGVKINSLTCYSLKKIEYK